MRNPFRVCTIIISIFAISQLFGWAHLSNGRVSASSLDLSRQVGLASKNEWGAEVNNDKRFLEPQASTCGDDRWDSQFHTNGANEDIFATAVNGTDLYLGGAFVTAGDKVANGIAKFDTVTQTWSALGTGVSGVSAHYVYAVAISGTDVYVSGTFTSAGGVSANRIAKFDTVTSTWSALGSGLEGSGAVVNAIAVIGSDVYAGGVFSLAGGLSVSNIAKWDTVTNSWSPVGTGVAGTVRAMAVNGSDLYVSGSFSSAGGVTATNVAKWSGSAWSALIAGATNGVGGASYAMHATGTDVYISSANTIVRWDGSTLTSLGGPSLNTMKAVHKIGSDVYAGGIGSSFGRWNGTSWTTTIGGGIVTGTEGVYSIKDIGGHLFVAGRIINAGGIGVFRIAKLELTTDIWTPIDNGNGIGGFGGTNRMRVIGSSVFVVGDFRAVGTMGNVILGKWDSISQTWSPVGGVTTGVSTMTADGTDLYVGGAFTSIGGVSANNIAKYDSITSTWSALGTGVNSSVSAISVSGGVVYVGGAFSTAGGSAASKLARFDISTATWSPMGSGITGSFDTAYSIAASGNKVYVGGSFTSIGGVFANRIGSFDISTGTWSALGGGISGNSQIIYSIAVNGTDVYVGGSFTTANSTITVNGIAKWNGTSWSAMGSGASPASTAYVYDLKVIGSEVYAAGAFTTMGGITVNNVAKWNGAGWTGLGNGVQSNGSLSAVDTMGSDVYIGGVFYTAGNKPSNLFGRYSDASLIWTGSIDSDWDTPGNWAGGVAPSSGAYVSIPDSGVANEPVISGNVDLCNLTIGSGRSLAVSGTGSLAIINDLSMKGNNITVGNTAGLTIGSNAAISRASGHILGSLKKTVSGPGNFVFHVGTASGYTPVTINFDTGAGDFSVRANSGAMSGLDPSRSLLMNWTLTSNGISQADITAQYLQSDVPVSAGESFFVFHRNTGGTITTPGISSLNTTTNVATINNVTQFSDWTLGEPSAVGCLAGQATWDGGGSTNNWSDGANWICDTMPTTTDIVYFDNRNSKNVTIDQPLTLGGLQLNPGFTGIISQGSSNVLLNGGFLLRSGTWSGGSGGLTINGDLTKQAGTFTGGSGDLDLNGSLFVTGALTMTSGTASISGPNVSTSGSGFAHNSGTIVFDSAGPMAVNLTSSTNLNNVRYNTSDSTVSASPAFIILGNFELMNGLLGGGTLDARGNVTVGAEFDGGSGSWQFGGTATQSFTNNGGVNPTGPFVLNKTGGTVNLASDLDLSGGTGNVILTNGTITTGTSLVNVGTRNVSRTSGRIIGNLRRTFNAVGSKTFDVGTANGYAPVAVNVTTLATNPSSLTISSNQTVYLGMNPAQSAARSWSIAESGDVTGNLTFTYLQTDVVGSEADYKLYRWESSVPELIASTLNTTSNTFTANGISTFSDWTIGNLAPSAASASISGRVISAFGGGIAKTELTVTDNDGQIRRAVTNGFGYYRLEGLEPGRTYILRVRSKRYSFANPVRIIVINDDLTGEDFVADSK